MHSLIIQLKDSKDTPNETDWCDFEETFCGEVADYVGEVDDPEEALTRFIEELDGFKYNDEDNSITLVSKEEFFRPYFNYFKKVTENTTMEDFQSSAWAMRVHGAIDEMFGMYIYDGFGWYRLVDFFRGMKEGTTWYIGTILDYHA